MANIATLHIDTTTYLIRKDRDQAGVFESRAAATYPAGTVLGRRTADGVWLPVLAGEADGTAVPKAVLMETLTTAAAAEAIPTHVLLEGEVRTQLTGRFVATGTPLTALTPDEQDTLRSYGVLSTQTLEVLNEDNDAPTP